MTLEFPVAPMTATLGSLPAASDDDRWAYEIKWDGYRTIAFVARGATRLQSRSLLDVTTKYPEVDDLAGSVNAHTAILDGELVCFDDNGRPSFETLQRHEVQAVLHVFDVLMVDGRDTVELPYEDRRRIVADLVEPGPNWLVPVHRVGDGAALLAATAERGMEGVMAKRLGTRYQLGRRSRDWRKVKNRIRTEVVIGGYSSGTGARSTSFGALLVGVRDNGRLRFAGGVGTGFDHSTIEQLRVRLAELRTKDCPFEPMPPREYVRTATWVRPKLAALIELTEFTNDGYVRQASFIDLIDR